MIGHQQAYVHQGPTAQYKEIGLPSGHKPPPPYDPTKVYHILMQLWLVQT